MTTKTEPHKSDSGKGDAETDRQTDNTRSQCCAPLIWRYKGVERYFDLKRPHREG